jgi:hypothetical protein
MKKGISLGCALLMSQLVFGLATSTKSFMGKISDYALSTIVIAGAIGVVYYIFTGFGKKDSTKY